MRVGFIGAALGHPVAFAGALRSLGVEVSGIWGREADAASKLGEQARIPLLSGPEDVLKRSDAVIVTTQTVEHAAYATMALELGKPVFVDKPLATGFSDAQKLVRRAEELGVPLMSASMRRYTPAFASIINEVRSGRAGKPISAVRFEPHGVKGGGWWQDRPAMSGGLIFNFGIHCVDTLQALLGPRAESVWCCAGKLQFPEVESHDTAVLTVRFANGAVGVAEVIGSMLPGESMATAPHLRVFCTNRSMEAKMLEDTAMEYSGRRLGVSPHYEILAGSVDMMHAFKQMLQCGEPVIPYREMLEVIAILDAARRSAAENRVVKLNEYRD